MTAYSRIALCALLMLASPALAEDTAPPPKAFYTYANNDAEYTIALPEAPTVKTIWTDSAEQIPYLDRLPLDGFVGELATFKRIDMATDEYYDVKVTFLKADQDFLAGLSPEKIKASMEKDFSGTPLDSKKFDFSVNPKNGMKWATLTGFSFDPAKRPLYNAEHYLTGQQSILVVKIQYNLENKAFADYYQALADSITYRPL